MLGWLSGQVVSSTEMCFVRSRQAGRLTGCVGKEDWVGRNIEK